MPFILLAIIGLGILSNYLFPLSYKSFLYGISLSLKSVIILVLPFIIFALLFKCAAQMARSKKHWIIGIIVAICISNFLSTLLSFIVSKGACKIDMVFEIPPSLHSLEPSFTWTPIKLFPNSYALFSGLILGLLLPRLYPILSDKVSYYLDKIASKILNILLILVPFFLYGFVIKLCYEGTLGSIFTSYGPIFLVILGSSFGYITLLHLIAYQFQPKFFILAIKNILPAITCGFGSMSSAAAMPLTILAAEKNGKNSSFARSIIPATVNIHLIGDCFAIPLFALAILKSLGGIEVGFLTYLNFAFYFVLAKFSVAAVPGGGILVMLPILESCLGFNAEMLSLITALYLLFDPVITAANIYGNSAFALLLEKILRIERSP